MQETQAVTKDPICGMSVNEGTALHADRDGKTFFFCSQSCRQEFLATPSGASPEGKPESCSE